MAYCTYTNVRSITNLDTNDISDEDMTTVIGLATYQLNADINARIVRERIDYIDNTRKNQRNGSNKKYYIQKWKDRYIGDGNGDGTIDVTDITVYQVASDGTETELTVSSIDPDNCNFTLETAPSSEVRIYVTYEWAYISENTPAPLVKLACMYLSAAMAFARINIGKATSVSLGDTSFLRHMDSYKEFYNKYTEVISQINSNNLIDYGEAEIV